MDVCRAEASGFFRLAEYVDDLIQVYHLHSTVLPAWHFLPSRALSCCLWSRAVLSGRKGFRSTLVLYVHVPPELKVLWKVG